MKSTTWIVTAGVLLAAAASGHAQTTFTQITNGPVVTDKGQFAGADWGDFENRGLLDLIVGNYGGKNVRYRNNGDGTFTNITAGDPIQDVANHTGAVSADYDNDGYLDLVVTAGGGGPTAQRTMLYHNDGDGTFTPASGGVVTNFTGLFNTAAWADYDNDGFVDLIVAMADPSGAGRNSLLFLNHGDGTFSSVGGAVVSDGVDAGSVAWADYDNDGYMDLLITSSGDAAVSGSFLYHNNRDRSFTRVRTNAVATDTWPDGALVATWGDYDNDGLPDLFVTSEGGNNRLYHNNGNGAFSIVTSGPMLGPPTGGSSLACAWGDYDNDGYLDLFVTSYNAPNRLFHNNGDGTFTEVAGGVFTNDSNSGIACQTCSWVDYDNDGFLDLFVTRFPDNGTSSNLLYHNNGNSNGWLEIKLVGTVANRSGIGAKVRAHATIGGEPFWQLHEMTGGGGRWSQPLVAHFGLGDATNVDTLRVEWPSGTVQEFQNVAPRQTLTITEPPRLLASITNGLPQFALKAWPGMRFDIQLSTDLGAWSSVATVTVTNLNGIARIIDTNAPGMYRRFYRAVSR